MAWTSPEHAVRNQAQFMAAGKQPLRVLEEHTTTDPQVLEPVPGVIRTKILLPKAKHSGGPEFYDNVRRDHATFAPTEVNATLGPVGSLSPDLGVNQKTWYNTWVYTPQELNGGGAPVQFQQRHYAAQPPPRRNPYTGRMEQAGLGPYDVKGFPTYIDTWKAQRRLAYIDEKLRKEEEKRLEEYYLELGYGVEETHYTDAYTGRRLISVGGQLADKDHFEHRAGQMHRSDWKDFKEHVLQGTDYANLRIPPPFEQPNRNKRISQHTYEWFDRQNPYIQSDAEYEIAEFESSYVDPVMWSKWRNRGGDGAEDFIQDVYDQALEVDHTGKY